MAKKVTKIIKLQIPAGKANPAPPIGPALGAAGVNIMGFCKEFNAKTQDKGGDILPVVITVYADKSFTFITKQPPVAQMIKKTIGLEKGSPMPNRDKVAKINRAQVKEIAVKKVQDMNSIGSTDEACLSSAMQMVIGTALSMGVEFVEG